MKQNFAVATMSLLIVAISSVNSQLPSDDLQPLNQPNLRHNPSLTRARRMYALCPPEFTKIGNDCYFLSTKKESWLDAHFDCKDKNSKLAEPLKFANRRLRKYLKNRRQANDDKWIGGMYNWQQNKWQWGYNGAEMKYHSFADEVGSDDLKYHCTTMDPKVDYQWSAKVCTERHNFICQHRMSYVNDKNRQKVYSKWNETYPNQLANEVEVYVSTNGNSNRSTFRTAPKKIRPNPNKTVQLNNQIPKGENSENAPDYLPFSVYSNLEQMQQKAQEDVIHPVRSHPQADNSRQPQLKPRKRHSRPLNLTGEVNLGTNKFKRREKKLRRKPVNTLEETVTNAGRHHHHQDIPNEIETTHASVSSSTSPSTSTQAPTELPISETTEAPVNKSLLLKKKLDEKALRRERLKQRLAELTPEERQAFLLMKQQRAEAKKRSLNLTN